MKTLHQINVLMCLFLLTTLSFAQEESIGNSSDDSAMMTNIDIINSMYQNFAKGDVPAVLALMDPNIEWNEAESNSLADGNPYKGPDAILNGVFARLGENHEYFKLEDVKLHNMDNDMVLATLRYNAKNRVTAKEYNAQAAHLWTLKDGKVIAFQQYADTKKLADAEIID